MLTTWLPWIALLVSIAAFFAQRKRAESVESPKMGKAAHMAGGLCVTLGIILAVIGATQQSALEGSFHFGLGAFGGLLLATLLGFLGSRFDPIHGNRLAPFMLGVAMASLTSLAPADNARFLALGLTFGSAMGAFILHFAPTHWPSVASVGAGAASASMLLGGYVKPESATFGGGYVRPELASISIGFATVFGVVALLAETALPRKEAGSPNPIALIVGAIVAAGGGWLLAQNGYAEPSLGIVFAAGALAGLVVTWLIPKEQGSHDVPLSLGLVIALGLATLAYGMGKGHAMSVALLGAVAITLFAGNMRAAAAFAPLAALVVYRLMREVHPDASKAMDIGQHYGLVGLLVGAAIPVVAIEWMRMREGGCEKKTAIGGLLWVPLFLALPLAGGIVIGAKGYVGLMAGVGIATAIAAFKGLKSAHALALQFGLSAMFAAQYGWVATKLDLTRDEKVQGLIVVAAVIALLSGAIAFLGRKSAES